ncbi:hypothetical protein ABK040_014136 [Willaertia magna]
MVPPDIIFTDENKVKEMIVDNILKEMKLNNNNNSNNQKDIEFIKLLLPSSTISLLEKYGKESEQQSVETPKEEEEEEDWDNWDEFDEFSDDEQHHGNKKNKNNTSTQQQLNLLKETILKDLDIHFKCLRSITKQRQADTPYQSLAKQIVHVLGEKDNCSDLTHNTSLLSSITNTFGKYKTTTVGKGDKRTFDKVLDKRTQMILYKLMNNGILNQISGSISSGKEMAYVFVQMVQFMNLKKKERKKKTLI